MSRTTLKDRRGQDSTQNPERVKQRSKTGEGCGQWKVHPHVLVRGLLQGIARAEGGVAAPACDVNEAGTMSMRASHAACMICGGSVLHSTQSLR